MESSVSEKMLVEAIIKNCRLDESGRNIYERDDIIRGLNEIWLMKDEYKWVKDKLSSIHSWERKLYVRAVGDGVRVSYRMRVGMMSRNETSPLTHIVTS